MLKLLCLLGQSPRLVDLALGIRVKVKNRIRNSRRCSDRCYLMLKLQPVNQYSHRNHLKRNKVLQFLNKNNKQRNSLRPSQLLLILVVTVCLEIIIWQHLSIQGSPKSNRHHHHLNNRKSNRKNNRRNKPHNKQNPKQQIHRLGLLILQKITC